ncbi:quaternary amine uptake ABC transporter (QAT) family, periplasmic amine-binding protein [Klebsiella michiganensis]|uniref:Quaternary amine uptake ABC transporter (QAT) family, periplasmic amine-binding protein n=1 Tax=Klebsiella michiganensis TaxID=1134687 RepID=A0A7H4PKJ0_9ENTR|nr:quaternary amine uptake ABC transporter (QAT) family, periplasmic amine-binding protein [Klebsiella michiganensis]
MAERISPKVSILANIYASALKKNDIAVKTRLNLGNREIIIPALQSGEIDIVFRNISVPC